MRFVGESLSRLAGKDPDRPALSCSGRIWTRAEVFARVSRLATEIRARSQPNARIALDLKRPDHMLIGFFAASLAGRIAMVFDPNWPANRRLWIEEETRPALILTESLVDAWLGTPGSRGPSHPEPLPEDPFYIGFTSGSTGTPKGYCRSHRSWTASFAVGDAEFPVTAADHVLIPGSLVHSLHLYGAVQGLARGARVALAREFNPRHLAHRLQQDDVSVLYGTPTQVKLIARELDAEAPSPSLRLLLVSGAKWRPSDRTGICKQFPKAGLVEFYGASEMSFITLSRPGERVPTGSVGRAAAGVRIEIRADDDTVLRPRETGRIWVKSDLLFDGYVCGGGSEIRRKGDWLTVGDHGNLDKEGFLYLAGREKRMLVTAGINLYPEEVETVLEAEPDVAEAAVFGLPDPVRGTRVVAVVRPEPDTSPDPQRLRRRCLQAVGLAATPTRIEVITSWPLTAGGKPDLEALKQMYEDGHFSGRRVAG